MGLDTVNNMQSSQQLHSVSNQINGFSDVTIISKNVFDNLDRNIRKINSFCPDSSVDSNFLEEDQIRPLIISFYQSNNLNNHSLNWHSEVRSLRKFARGFDRVIDDYKPVIFSKQLSNALELLDNKWRNSYLSGLIITLLKNWLQLTQLYMTNFRILTNFIMTKLNSYSGNRQLYKFISNNSDFFTSQNGALQFGAMLQTGHAGVFVELKEMHCPSGLLQFNYFDEVFISYASLQNLKNENTSIVIENIITSRTSLDVKRLLCAKYINEINVNFPSLKNTLKAMTLELVGDPQVNNYWNISDDLYKKYQSEVSKAKDILNLWINSEIVDIFFEKLSVYKERKDFWKMYIKSIPNIKITGNRSLKYDLMQDERIRDFIESRFIVAGSGCAALLLNVNNYLLVEYSQHGNAFYAYTSNRQKYSLWN